MLALLTLFLGTAFGWFCAKRHTSARNDDLQEEIDELQAELAKARSPEETWKRLVDSMSGDER
jgi:hypothetical protein